MAKTIKLHHPDERLVFGFKGRDIIVSKTMPMQDAELIAKQYPGQYLTITEEPETPAESESEAKATTEEASTKQTKKKTGNAE
ncbi:hypothetical protein GCM10028818_59830 [Spirosoma horti]